uniref:Uncharacterized protein n=1 Tax=Arundo donax TaxID=35708 RepID=A0A0A9FQS9_ARUDO
MIKKEMLLCFYYQRYLFFVFFCIL